MIRQTVYTGSDDAHEPSGADLWNRPGLVRYVGYLLVLCSSVLLIGGAYRMQANMITSGLLFLALGIIFAPGILQKGWPTRLGIGVLAAIGAVYTLLT